MRFDWSKLARPPPAALVGVRNLAHHAAQWATKAARANLSAASDDSHSAFIWDTLHAALVSQVLPAKGGGVRVGIRIARLELIVTSGSNVLDAYQFDGRTDAAAGAWIDSKLHALGLKPASGARLPYTLPDPPAGGRPHELGMLGREFGELSRWFAGAACFRLSAARSRSCARVWAPELRPGATCAPSPFRLHSSFRRTSRQPSPSLTRAGRRG